MGYIPKEVKNSSAVKFCTYCGTRLDENAKFCKNCGKAVIIGNPINLDSRYYDNDESNPTSRKTVYEGTLHKCPNCGEIVDALITNCPACGYEFRDATVSKSVNEFSRKLSDIDWAKAPNSSGNPSLFKRIFGTDFNDISENEKLNLKISLIKSFAIPNTKEDITEFIILASANIDLKVYGIDKDKYEKQRELSDAWLAKMEQAYQKAKILFPSTNEFKKISHLVEEKEKQIKKKKLQKSLMFFSLLGVLIVIILFCLIMSYLSS